MFNPTARAVWWGFFWFFVDSFVGWSSVYLYLISGFGDGELTRDDLMIDLVCIFLVLLFLLRICFTVSW